MTLEKLIGCSADELEKMSPEDLVNWFSPLLRITRPELYAQERKRPTAKQQELLSPEEVAKKESIKSILADLGVDLTDFDV